MVPTEVLAEQHHLAARQLARRARGARQHARLGGTRPLAVALLTSRTTAASGHGSRPSSSPGSLDLVVGTHALLTDNVRFRSLGVVVIDEQHRFGVEQRAALREKGPSGG